MHNGNNKNIASKILFIASATMIFVLIYYVSYHVPVHSDDCRYSLIGLSPAEHIRHYMKWSGRFITDYTSSILLNLFSRPVYMALNSIVFLLTMVLVCVFPNIVTKRNLIGKESFIVLWLIFILYWAANPNLGETSFWLVGSANYLWTIMWASIYICYFLHLLTRDDKMSGISAVLLFVFGFLAGLSNEALGISIVLFTMFMFFFYFKNRLFVLLDGLLATGIGYALLLFAPGNYKRMDFPTYASWHAMNIVDKFIFHVYTRMTRALGGVFLVDLLFLLVLFGALFILDKEEIDTKSLIFSIGFVVLSVCSLFVFLVSPAMPLRSENTALYLLLIAFSFAANMLENSQLKRRVIPLLFSVLIGLVFFIPSYSCVAYAYTQAKTQSEIRDGIIKDAIDNGSSSATVPNWFFTRLIKSGDMFDTFISHAAPEYYGIESINWKDVGFNFAVLQNGTASEVNASIKEGLELKHIYTAVKSPFENTIALEFNQDVSSFAAEGEKNIYVHLYKDGQEDPTDITLPLNKCIQIGNSYYYGITDPVMYLKGVNRIEIELTNGSDSESDSESDSTSVTVELNM